MAGEEDKKPIDDAFGVKRDVQTAQPIIEVAKQPEFVEQNGVKYVNEGGKPKLDTDGKPMPYKAKAETADEIENNPVVKELRSQLKKSEEDKASMGKSLSEQRTVFEKRLDALEKGGKQDTEKAFKPPFPEIKRVKDLPAAESAEMSETEKRLFDQNADMMERINATEKEKFDGQVASEKSKVQETEKQKEEREALEADETFNKDVQSRVSKLTSNNVALTNQIIEKFNTFKDNHLLEGDALDARIAEATKLVPDYKPAKQQQSPTGGAVENGGQNADDPFGIKSIIDEAKKGSSGNSYSL